jgi:CRISPR-associated protein Cmr2
VSNAFWQAKIWGLLHDPALKALQDNSGRGGNSFWRELNVMTEWVANNWNPEESRGIALQHIHNADFIASASDRAAIGGLSHNVDYDRNGLEIAHLLSGAKQQWKLKDSEHERLIAPPNRQNRKDYLNNREIELLPELIRTSNDPRMVFWWLWRCLPQAVCQAFNDDSLLLMPAETRIPDGSIWSHASLTAALAGALTGYDLPQAEIQRWSGKEKLSRPCIAAFSFTPVQELIKASRKMRDFWAGSWILHYLSARICWAIAWKYGPDTVLYPSLYAQPLIDYWLLHGIGQTEGDFKGWRNLRDFADFVKTPCDRAILTAGFPNVLVFILPQDKVQAAMQTAKQTLDEEWLRLGQLSFEQIRSTSPNWMQGLEKESALWEGWLASQWQNYWVAYPVGDPEAELRSSELYKTNNKRDAWTEKQNQFCLLPEYNALFHDREREFLIKAGELRQQKWGRYPFKANVGSWWNHIFDRTRLGLAAMKNARNWELPAAFGVRSTISGVGSALHADPKDSEASIKQQWQTRANLFDGREMLNASETLKRALHKTLPKLFPAILTDESDRIDAAYPDLTAGVAGYLKTYDREHTSHFEQACRELLKEFPKAKPVIHNMRGKWGIPYADENWGSRAYEEYHPRLLNQGWLLEDMNIPKEEQPDMRNALEQAIAKFYPNNNPADWYVLASGDGDGMNEWLKGKHLKPYEHYIPATLLKEVRKSSNDSLEASTNNAFLEFVKQTKRMGASTHNALSRALLDFSNQLVPYLTEQRYAGRLIYGGGDDVLAYTNLWEWDKWLWDIRQCFRGDKDDLHHDFSDDGDYWQWKDKSKVPESLSPRPLFTMGGNATISFGVVIAHHSVPLAIALEHLWEAEKEDAKKHKSPNGKCKDAVQVRVIYGNGNVLRATSKFDTFNLWQELLEIADLESAIFEQAATVWEQHPVPTPEAIAMWCKAFCDRREQLTDDNRERFHKALTNFLERLWVTTEAKDCDREVQNWLKLAAFTLRKRNIKIN